MNNLLKKSALALTLSAVAISASAQESQPNPEYTGASFLSITPDARGAGMGDVGVATSADVNSQFWNPAKYAFAESASGIGFTYTPWLSKLVSDIGLSNLAGYYQIDDRQAISGSFRYFSLGKIDLTDASGNIINQASPNEMTIDLGYSRRLSNKFSMAVAMRYIYSGLDVSEESSVANGFSADIAGFYTSPVYVGAREGNFSFGFNISNIGTKMSYDDGNTSFFIPTNMRLGAAFTYPFDDYNKITASVDLSKLLVPTPPVQGTDEADEEYDARYQKYLETSPISGIFKSFSDAPGGFSEELKEIRVGVGAEYSYNDQFFGRLGYFYESPEKGNRKFFSIGAGFKLSAFRLDASYLIASQSSPLDQTIRVSLAFDIDGMRNLLRR
ncbi:MAG: type IX secretion system outer membrane channel protein PorV [Bacteroidales bacterium]